MNDTQATGVRQCLFYLILELEEKYSILTPEGQKLTTQGRQALNAKDSTAQLQALRCLHQWGGSSLWGYDSIDKQFRQAEFLFKQIESD